MRRIFIPIPHKTAECDYDAQTNFSIQKITICAVQPMLLRNAHDEDKNIPMYTI
jgi:hypothetical protein